MSIGIVVIGRNEGDRLARSLRSVSGLGYPVVYVDSGSADRSVEVAKDLGLPSIELDASRPFSAARARNEGLQWMTDRHAELRFVQFLDGDCELTSWWLGKAVAAMEGRDRVAIVCGRLSEKHPGSSVYHRYSQVELAVPPGDSAACGGIFLGHVAAIQSVDAFDETLVCGEEPELCHRLRCEGWSIQRIDEPMGTHDLGPMRFGQWWKRMVRGGYAFAQGTERYGERNIRATASIWLWAVILPTIIAASSIYLSPWCAAIVLVYPLQALRIARASRRRAGSASAAASYGVFCVIAKWPLWLGQCKFVLVRLSGEQSGPIEYKTAETPGADQRRESTE